jgi:hypothetical protein
VRRALVLLAAVGSCVIAAAPAGATNECRGLQVCVPVVGPWVVAAPGRVEFQLACPQRYIVAGLDAELTSRGIEVGFVGALGSPVNPGITTSREAVFLGRVVRDVAGATFRPHIGCVPASGGGRRTPTAYHPFPPGKPTIRHVVNFNVRAAGTTTHGARCAKNEQLVSATYAIGFLGDTPPSDAAIGSVKATQHLRKGLVLVTVHAAKRGRAVLQLDLVCAPR